MEYDIYCADTAQRCYDEKKLKKGRKIKALDDFEFLYFLEEMIIKKKYSPDAVLSYIKKNALSFDTTVCMKTLYNYIDHKVFKTLSNKHLHIKKNRKPKKQKDIKTKRRVKNDRKSIEMRPRYIEERKESNHWEMDCIESGKGCKAALLVLTERTSRKCLIFKLSSKTIDEVIHSLDSLERKHKHHFKKIFRTITIDNGSEFLGNELIERSLYTKKNRTQAYYCHPYSSYERGSNENANRIIRYHIPKGCDIGNYSDDYIKYVETWINDYPRKIFNYKSSNEVYSELCINLKVS